jgi:two-component system chemotaxis response regulator CheB
MAQKLLKNPCKLVVIGGSAGSLDVILKVLPQLTTGSSLSVVLVMHRKNTYDLSLSDLLATKTDWAVSEAEEKQALKYDNIYLAPADYHLLIENDHSLSLDVSEKVNYSRPSIDVTFESAAEVFKEELACILLSGANEDGVQGLKKVKQLGGITIVQNPDSAAVSYMPQQAINQVDIDLVVEAAEIGQLINQLGTVNQKPQT